MRVSARRLSRLPRLCRIIAVICLLEVKSMIRSFMFITSNLAYPIISATIAFYLFGASRQGITLLYAALGAGLMGIWSSTLLGSGGAIGRQRNQGTLETL